MSIAAVTSAPIAAPSASEIRPVERGPEPGLDRAGARPDLAESFSHALSEARTQEQDATTAAQRFADGDPGMGIHEVMIASEKATLAVRYATTLKNKAVEAYRELMNTQV